MPAAVVAIGIIYGLCLFLKALIEMGPAAPYFLGFCLLIGLILFIGVKIEDRKKEKETY